MNVWRGDVCTVEFIKTKEWGRGIRVALEVCELCKEIFSSGFVL